MVARNTQAAGQCSVPAGTSNSVPIATIQIRFCSSNFAIMRVFPLSGEHHDGGIFRQTCGGLILTLPWRGSRRAKLALGVDANPAMRSIVRRAAGWGDSLSSRTVPELRDCHPTPSRILFRAMRADPPPPGE